jgi:hypothetical protein
VEEAYGGREVNIYGMLVGKPKERDGLRPLSVDAKTVLKWILKKEDGRV